MLTLVRYIFKELLHCSMLSTVGLKYLAKL